MERSTIKCLEYCYSSLKCFFIWCWCKRGLCMFAASAWDTATSHTTPRDACILQVVGGSDNWHAAEEHHPTTATTLAVTCGRVHRVLWWLSLVTVVIVTVVTLMAVRRVFRVISSWLHLIMSIGAVYNVGFNRYHNPDVLDSVVYWPT